MARAKAASIGNKGARLKLPISKKPVFESLGDGISIGYRRNQGAGTWIARKSDGKGGSWQKVIGLADDFDVADDDKVLSFAQAQSKVHAAAKMGKDAVAKIRHEPTTVRKAIERYKTDLVNRNGDAGNVTRLEHNLTGSSLLDIAMTDLTAADLRDWRDGLLKRLAPATVNRTVNAMKAALNLAADHDDRILTRNAWEKGLKALPDAEQARNIILPDASVKKIVDAAKKQGNEVALLVEVAAVTGARYSQIAALEVQDLKHDGSGARVLMPTSKKGKGVKKVLRRPIPIPDSLAKKLTKAAEGREPCEPLLTKPNGDPWKKSDHSRPFSRAVVSAGLTPSPSEDDAPEAPEEDDQGDRITIYALRHSSIVRQILKGVPVRVVAVMHDTSVAMIEKNYSHYIADHSDAIARAALLDFSAPSKPKRKPAKQQ